MNTENSNEKTETATETPAPTVEGLVKEFEEALGLEEGTVADTMKTVADNASATSDADEAAAIEQLEAQEAAKKKSTRKPNKKTTAKSKSTKTTAKAAKEPAPEPTEPPQREWDKRAWSTQFNEVSDDDADKYIKSLRGAIDKRKKFETAKNPDNLNIHKTLAKIDKKIGTTRAAAKAFIVCQVPADFVMQELHDGSRYNVYAIEKVHDLIQALADGVMPKNSINLNIVRSLFNVTKNGETFDMNVAKAAASNKMVNKLSPAIRKLVSSHTVSASTAPTQSSSTMQALQTIGVVDAWGGGRNPKYRINSGAPAKALRTIYEKSLTATAE